MKNILISVLSAYIITGLEFWEFEKASDRPIITATIALLIFIGIVSFDAWIKERRMKRFRADRFWRQVNENRP